MPFAVIKNINNFIYQHAFRYKHGVRWILALAVALFTIFLYEFDLFSRLELLSLDYRFILRHPKPEASDIVFIDMGEDSIKAIGVWPWQRRWHAALVKILSEHNPKAIAFDVIFSEPQDKLDDSALEEAIRNSQVVYLSLLYNLGSACPKYIYKGEDIMSALRPLPYFEDYAKGVGHVNAIPDRDGILRRVPPVITFEGKTTYQLGMKIGFDLLGLKDEDILFYPERHAIILKMAGSKLMRIPLDDNNDFVINWVDKWGREFKHFSYIDVIRSYALKKEGKLPLLDLDEFRNKICIVGLTAAGLIDIKPIPIENAYPAVGINATIINNVLNNDFIYNIPKIYNILIIILISILITLSLSNLRLLGGMSLAAISMICYFIVSAAAFGLFNIALSTFYPIFAIFLSYSLTSLYTQVLQSIERARLFKQATRDGLTYLYNIRHFNLLLEAEFKNVALYKFRRLSLIMADVDNFKHANDTYGHRAGDAILREAARIMQSKCRQTDVVARYGGEEFIVMLSGAGEKEAFDIADKIRAAIESKKFRFKNETYYATISLGVSEYSGEKDKEELIEKADKALYKAKHEGKNRVCTYSSAEGG